MKCVKVRRDLEIWNRFAGNKKSTCIIHSVLDSMTICSWWVPVPIIDVIRYYVQCAAFSGKTNMLAIWVKAQISTRVIEPPTSNTRVGSTIRSALETCTPWQYKHQELFTMLVRNWAVGPLFRARAQYVDQYFAIVGKGLLGNRLISFLSRQGGAKFPALHG